jgi:hypothetical protein
MNTLRRAEETYVLKTKEEMDRPLPTEAEQTWNILYSDIFTIERYCDLCKVETYVLGIYSAFRRLLLAKQKPATNRNSYLNNEWPLLASTH